MTHANAKEFLKFVIGKNWFYSEPEYMNFALNLGDFSKKYCLYPFSSCKEYILDSMLSYCLSQDYAVLKTGLAVRQSDLNVEAIEETIKLAEQQLGFETSSLELVEKDTLSIIGDSYWSITPYTLSFFALIVRVAQQHGSFDIFNPKFKSTVGDLSTFSFQTYKKFLQDLKDRKFENQKQQFSNPFTGIHSSGIRNYLYSSHAK